MKLPVTASSTVSPRFLTARMRLFGKDKQVLPRQVTGRQDGLLQEFRARGGGRQGQLLLGGELFQVANQPFREDSGISR